MTHTDPNENFVATLLRSADQSAPPMVVDRVELQTGIRRRAHRRQTGLALTAAAGIFALIAGISGLQGRLDSDRESAAEPQPELANEWAQVREELTVFDRQATPDDAYPVDPQEDSPGPALDSRHLAATGPVDWYVGLIGNQICLQARHDVTESITRCDTISEYRTQGVALYSGTANIVGVLVPAGCAVEPNDGNVVDVFDSLTTYAFHATDHGARLTCPTGSIALVVNPDTVETQPQGQSVVPIVVGMSEEAALDALQAAGFPVATSFAPADTTSASSSGDPSPAIVVVIAQTPAGGESSPRSTPIEITLSR